MYKDLYTFSYIDFVVSWRRSLRYFCGLYGHILKHSGFVHNADEDHHADEQDNSCVAQMQGHSTLQIVRSPVIEDCLQQLQQTGL